MTPDGDYGPLVDAGSSEWQAWMQLLQIVLHPSVETPLLCPHCGAQTVESRFFVGDKRVGWGALWCDTCNYGVQLSRVAVPVEIDAKPISAENSVPKFEIVTPT